MQNCEGLFFLFFFGGGNFADMIKILRETGSAYSVGVFIRSFVPAVLLNWFL